MREIYSKLLIQTPERRQWRRFGVFIVNFELISYIVRLLPLLFWTSQLPSENTA